MPIDLLCDFINPGSISLADAKCLTSMIHELLASCWRFYPGYLILQNKQLPMMVAAHMHATIIYWMHMALL
jgi:hypothetical protein